MDWPPQWLEEFFVVWVRDILNEYKWRDGLNLDDLEIWYIHRGAPNDTMIIKGSEIEEIGRSFMELKGATIPYHRVIKIIDADKTVFQR